MQVRFLERQIDPVVVPLVDAGYYDLACDVFSFVICTAILYLQLQINPAPGAYILFSLLSIIVTSLNLTITIG